ncbi:NAD(P)/FAD-dependent oxidoreductase [Chitinimonas sp.]|uniref:NAD(P)/FAD-dependent oxidoreductase n=1 Tax=Chitinimonas sp. TaxID=1934313 RepID=UPI0035AFA128
MSHIAAPTPKPLAPGARIAVIGGGISGIASAWLLSRRYQLSLFEANDYVGGHTNTVDITLEGQTYPVDTGFLVFNNQTYPNLIALFDELKVPVHASDMSFGVSVDQGRVEWAGTDLGTVFAQRRNLLSPRFLGMLRDILRFNKAAPAYLQAALAGGHTLGTLLDQERYGQAFRDWYLLPMAAAIWSSSPADILQFPAATFLRFCLNHSLLQVNDRPQWKTVLGGARLYVERMLPAIHSVRRNTPVQSVERDAHGVTVRHGGSEERFDAVVLATHAPDTLAMLRDASTDERAILGSVRYQPNLAILHTDPGLLPRNCKVWSAWNYLAAGLQHDAAVCVSYLLNQLQPLPFETPVVVTLNPVQQPDPRHELARFHYQHPVFDQAAIDAQQRLPSIQGQHRSWFAGAWTGYGFHEDGLKSALRVAADCDCLPDWARL